MGWNVRRIVLLLAVLAALVSTAPVQAFSFCFSFGSNDHRYSHYDRYPPPFPPTPSVYYPADPNQVQLPGTAYAPAYPLLPSQPYEALMPVYPGW